MNISCVIVNYNNAAYLERAVLSVLRQTLPPDEIIIADDASTDGSAGIINRLAKESGCVRPIFRKKNLGVAANRDLAIKESCGTFFTTLDSDDWFYPEKIEREWRALNGALDKIACSDIDLIGENDVSDTIHVQGFCDQQVPERYLLFLVSRKKGMPRDMLMSKQLYMSVGGMRHSLKRYEDWDLKLRLAERKIEWVYSNSVGTAYRRIGEGLSSASQARLLFDKFRVLLPCFAISQHKQVFVGGVFNLLVLKGMRKLLASKANQNEII